LFKVRGQSPFCSEPGSVAWHYAERAAAVGPDQDHRVFASGTFPVRALRLPRSVPGGDSLQDHVTAADSRIICRLPGCTFVTTTPFTSEGSCKLVAQIGIRFSSATPSALLPWDSPGVGGVSPPFLLMLSSVNWKVGVCRHASPLRPTLVSRTLRVIAAVKLARISIFLPLSQ